MHTKGENYSTIEAVLSEPSLRDFLINQGHERQLQFMGDLKLLNLIHGITLNGKYCCLWCLWNSRQYSRKEQLTVQNNYFESRTFQLNAFNFNNLDIKYNGNPKLSKFCFSVQAPSLVQIFYPEDTPILSTTPPPELHILLGIINKTQKCILASLTETQKV